MTQQAACTDTLLPLLGVCPFQTRPNRPVVVVWQTHSRQQSLNTQYGQQFPIGRGQRPTRGSSSGQHSARCCCLNYPSPRPQCAVNLDRSLKPKLAIMRQCTSVTDRRTYRRTLTSQHKREMYMYILHLALKTQDGVSLLLQSHASSTIRLQSTRSLTQLRPVIFSRIHISVSYLLLFILVNDIDLRSIGNQSPTELRTPWGNWSGKV